MATFLFFPEGAFGPTNNCVGIGHVLRQRGHRVVFVIEESFAGTLAARGFDERLVRLGPPPELPELPGQFWKDFVAETSPVFRHPTIAQLEGFVAPTFAALCDGALYVDDSLHAAIEDVAPDVVVEDNVVSFPAILTCGRPWVRIMSCNPLELPDRALPPVFSGYPTTDRGGWAEFRAEADRVLGPVRDAFDAAATALGAPPLPAGAFVHQSAWLNLSLFPAELDYARADPLPATWHVLESSVRGGEAPWEPPPDLGEPSRPLVYLSLGSLGSADLPLMRQLVDALAGAPYRVVVSQGPRYDELELPAGMAGAEFLPQTSVLPQVDIVITHGGNNTVTECVHFGRPMVVLPLFWDQHDNAQRVQETGLGRRLDTYRVGRDEIVDAVDSLLERPPPGLVHAARRLQAAPGTERAADLLERLAATGDPVVRR